MGINVSVSRDGNNSVTIGKLPESIVVRICIIYAEMLVNSIPVPNVLK